MRTSLISQSPLHNELFHNERGGARELTSCEPANVPVFGHAPITHAHTLSQFTQRVVARAGSGGGEKVCTIRGSKSVVKLKYKSG